MAEADQNVYEGSMKRVAAIRILHRRAEAEYKRAKADADSKKKKVDQLQVQFNQAMDEEMEPNLFSKGIRPSEAEIQKVAAEEEAKMAGAASAAPAGDSPAAPAQPEEWRGVSIDVLPLGQKVIDALKAHQPGGKSAHLDTLGGLADFQARDGRYSDIKGVGKANADKIADAVVDWLAKNRPAELEVSPPAESPAATVTDDSEAADAPAVDEHGFPAEGSLEEQPKKKGGKKK